MNKLLITLTVANVALWSFNAGTMYHLLERIEGPRVTAIKENN